MTLKPKNGSKLHITLPDPQPVEYWWEPGNSPASIEEERGLSEYDCGYLDLGTESPASTSTLNLMESSGFVENRAAGVALHIPTRRPPSRRCSPPAINHPSKFNKSGVDRDCGICFEYAVVPCRALCCGKIFCTEHLADWLHGPNAEGRCPNCENACSLEGGTLSLASPISHSSQGRRNNLTQSILPSPLILLQHHSNDTLTTSRDRLHPEAAATSMKNSSTSPYGSVTRTSSTCSSTVDYSEATVSTEDSKTIGEQRHIHHTFQKEGPLSSSFSPPWGVVSRLISIVIFLMFLYKLRS